MRYAYATTAALLLGGSAVTLTTGVAGAQVAQNEEGQVARAAPPGGAPQSFANLVEQLQPAVVNISTDQTVTVPSNPMMDFFQGRQPNARPQTQEGQSLGSGFLISADGFVVTNNHVVSPGTEGAVVNAITVTLPDRKEYVAKLVGRDPSSDLAVLKIDAPAPLPFVKLGDSEALRVGDWVVAIGNPLGQSGTVTAGIVSALHRVTGQGGLSDRFIQTDAAINRGNSGGPLFDMSGQVVGINSQILSQTGGNIGIGLAIPAREARPVIAQLMRGAAVERGYLGVQIQQIDDDLATSLGLDKNRGELIAGVTPGGAADKAGIQQGDVVVTVNGRAVTPDNTLSYLVADVKPGTRVPLELIRRDGRRQTVTATLQQRPSDDELAKVIGGGQDGMAPEGSTPQQGQAGASLGLLIQPLTATIAEQLGVPAATRGVVIAAIDGSSKAAQIGFQRGDIILSVNRRAVTTPEEVQSVVDEAAKAGRDSVALLVQRGRGPARYVSVPFTQ